MSTFELLKSVVKVINESLLNTLEYLITVHAFSTLYSQIKRSHSIHILSIQIDTQNFELVIDLQFNNVKLSFFANILVRSFPLRMF